MYNLSLYPKLLDKKFVANSFTTISLLALIPLCDVVVFLIIKDYLGLPFCIALLCFQEAISLLTLSASLRSSFRSLKETHEENHSLVGLLDSLLGSYAASVFILLPGILSTLLGLIVLLYPPLRRHIGRAFSRSLSINWHSVHEYVSVWLT